MYIFDKINKLIKSYKNRNYKVIDKIDELVKVREDENSQYDKGFSSNRFKYITQLLDSFNIEYDIIRHDINSDITIRNIYISGKSNKLFVSHHDVFDINSENANDNSCSIINLIALRLLNPDVNIAITDGEEIGMLGGKLILNDLKDHFPDVNRIMVLELTGIGQNISITNYNNSKLYKEISDNFNVIIKNDFPTINEAYEINREKKVETEKKVEAELVVTAPTINNKINFNHLYDIHSKKDKLSKINKKDMNNFVNNFLLPLSKF